MKKKDNRGFTLLEVVCAAAMLAIVIIPVCSGFLTVANGNARAREKMLTVNMLENELEYARATGSVRYYDPDSSNEDKIETEPIADVISGTAYQINSSGTKITFEIVPVDLDESPDGADYYTVTVYSGEINLALIPDGTLFVKGVCLP